MARDSGLPWFKLRAGQWLGDARMRMLSHATKGVLVDILCLANGCDDRGVLAMNGRPLSDEQIIRAVGGGASEVAAALSDLLAAGVLRRRKSDGAICCEEMVGDEAERKDVAERKRKSRASSVDMRTSKRGCHADVTRMSHECHTQELEQESRTNSPRYQKNDDDGGGDEGSRCDEGRFRESNIEKYARVTRPNDECHANVTPMSRECHAQELDKELDIINTPPYPPRGGGGGGDEDVGGDERRFLAASKLYPGAQVKPAERRQFEDMLATRSPEQIAEIVDEVIGKYRPRHVFRYIEGMESRQAGEVEAKLRNRRDMGAAQAERVLKLLEAS